jgi:hypothetical protein
MHIKEGFKYQRGNGVGFHPCGGTFITYPDGRKVYKCITGHIDGKPYHKAVNPEFWQAMDDADLRVGRSEVTA